MQKGGPKKIVIPPDVPKEQRLKDLNALYQRCLLDIEKNGLLIECRNGSVKNPALQALFNCCSQIRRLELDIAKTTPKVANNWLEALSA